MIVTWSETYLRQSLTNAFNAIRSSPPNVSQYLTQSTSSPAPRRTEPTTQLSSAVNRTDNKREAASTTTL